MTAADRSMRLLFAAAAGLTLARVGGLIASPIELHGDEAQYWAWSQDLSWGYFTKPPLIAWVIAATTSVFGDGEWAVRLAAPFLHAATAIFLGLLGRDLFNARAGFWAGIIYLLLPAVWLSAGVMSTDALLLTCVSAALLSLRRLIVGGSLGWGVALGLSVGAGFLAKYAMIYFLAGLVIVFIVDRQARRALISFSGLAAIAAALVVIAPNLAWNAANDFATVSHTAANANWGGSLFRLGNLLEFWIDQIAVLGPIPLILITWAVVALRRMDEEFRAKMIFLLAFIIPALVIVSGQAFISRANANWAAFSVAAGSLLVAGWALERGLARLLALTTVIHGVVGVAFVAVGLAPSVGDALGLANAVKRARGWEETVAAVRVAYAQGADGEPYAAVAVDNRMLYYELTYYGRADPLPLVSWLRYAEPVSQAELTAPLSRDTPSPVLVVSERPSDRLRLLADFAVSRPLDEVVIDLGPCRRCERRLFLFAGEGFDPLERGPAYEEAWASGE